MGIRTHPNLRLENDPERGVTTANGHAINSEGVEGRNVWGKRAKWVDYWGTINDKTGGVAIFALLLAGVVSRRQGVPYAPFLALAAVAVVLARGAVFAPL